MLSFSSILSETGKGSIEALHYCNIDIKIVLKSKVSPIYGIISIEFRLYLNLKFFVHVLSICVPYYNRDINRIVIFFLAHRENRSVTL